jgi:phosphatidylglycerol:prolipoprotein diacylglycerol transferase
MQVFAIYSGGIGLWGGIVGGFAGGSIYCVITKQPVGIISDLAAPVLPFAQSIGRLGDIVNGEHCAKATDLFFGMRWINDASPARLCSNGISNAVHPVIVYEMIWNTLCLVILWKLRGRLRPDGMLFVLYIALYAFGRFWISFLREDRLWALGMQEAHYIALLVLAVTVPLLAIKARVGDAVWALDPGAVPLRERGTRAERRRKRR